MAVLSRGTIVWVEITDPQGRNPKCRPAVVVSPNEDMMRIIVQGIRLDWEAVVARAALKLQGFRPHRQHDGPHHRRHKQDESQRLKMIVPQPR